jgi:hypothetical protein
LRKVAEFPKAGNSTLPLPERSEGSGTEDAMNFEQAGKLIDEELKNFVEFVEQKVRPKTRQEMAELLRKASKNLTKMAQSLEKK